MAELDHIILGVEDVDESVAFYTGVMGFRDDGTDGPFTVIRVNDGFVILLAGGQTPDSEHLAFSLSRREFDAIFERVKSHGLDYGPGPDSVGTSSGPGVEDGARGGAPTLYFHDPSGHLLEIRTYASGTGP